MDLGIKGQVALVLAASKGLGRASAEALAGEGVQVVIGSRNVSTSLSALCTTARSLDMKYIPIIVSHIIL